MVANLRLRSVLSIAGFSLLTVSGCAFPHGNNGGDPALGNWNRPIAPTPPPWTGGMGGGSPAYDAGARVGVPSPDVPSPTTLLNANSPASRTSWNMPSPITPANTDYAVANTDKQKSWTDRLFHPTPHKTPPSEGPKLQASEQLQPLPAIPTSAAKDGFPAGSSIVLRPQAPINGIVAGSALPPELHNSTLRLVAPQGESAKIQSVEEGQMILVGYGLKWQTLQQVENGDWQYSCVVAADLNGTNYRRYDARHPSAVEAVRAIVDQARKDRQ
ncbi:hypothetical protein KIH39_21630 [Telmatocola sphagniphila]|uniref:Uncharacterized protein n=1 Tax=Telmatocola sphagniphila TaxID=1123043 RepID=A0A8E6EXM0_9BACT|nr:hypothetical protein [Telmatocola sphagniphila]QVL31421.1 hypothetical protein KIH39_21630 [Telmatocola sphagniphila]